MTDQPSTLAEALALLQAELPPIAKASTAQYGKYADLADVTKQIMPKLGALGLSFTARPTLTDHGFVLAYELRHVSDEAGIGGEYPLPGVEKGPQALGSAITYARRYCLCAVTGVAPDADDDDAAAAEQQAAGQEQSRKPARTPRGKTTTAAPTDDGGTSGLEPEYEPGSALPSQLKAIHTSLTALGITDRDKCLTAVEQIIGHPIAGPHRTPDESDRTSKNLSWQDAEKARRELAGRAAAAQREKVADP
jgi:ERF superfamily